VLLLLVFLLLALLLLLVLLLPAKLQLVILPLIRCLVRERCVVSCLPLLPC
jgi:hypothetical protein